MRTRRDLRRLAIALLPVALVATSLLGAASAQAAVARAAKPLAAVAPSAYVPPTSAPFDGLPISQGLGPTYGETWCAAPAPGTSIANQQTQSNTLALVPYEAIGCLLAQFQQEAVNAGVPARMTYSILGQTDAGRDQYGVVVNALETPAQVQAYENWQAYRAIALTDPVAAAALLESFGDNVKIPVFVENNIHGDEEEGADSMMQIIRDLTTTPYGAHPTIDHFLDHAILITIPSMNPDGRFLGTRANGNGYDMNRDWLVQSQPEVRNNIALQVQWLAPVMLATHGYVNPTLIDGLTKPHNPGLEYDIFLYWNQLRLDANQDALARIGQGITRPVNGPIPNNVNPAVAPSRGACSNGNVPAPASNICGTGGIAAGTGLTQVGTTVTVTTPVILSAPVKVSDTVIISGAAEAGYNGGPFRVTSVLSPTQFTYEAAASGLPASGGNSYLIADTGLSKTGTTVTVTTVAPSNVVAGNTVAIANAPVNGYNGNCTNAVILNPTQFTCTQNATVQPASGGGSLSVGAAVGIVQVQTGPNQAEGWDDLGPFYTQTYSAFFGVDGSTLEMCSNCVAPFTGRLGSKTAQYVGFWSSADFWIENREAMLGDQAEIFVRGAQDADRPNCCDDPLIAGRGFTEAEHDWMEPYPRAYVIPMGGGGQRSDAEANRMADWLLDNGITVQRATADFDWDGTTYPEGSYVVPMDQPMRGLAFTALGAGVDYSVRINQLYAPPGAWSHGLMWGADTAEVPHGDASFDPSTEVITAVSALSGGVAEGASDFYSVTLRGVRELQAVYDLLRDGHYGELAEAPFVSTSGGPTPAGSLIFNNDPVTVAALEAAGAAAGIVFERNVAVVKPATTKLSEAPRVAILANANAAGVIGNTDASTSLRTIFGPNAQLVSLLGGPNSIQNAATDPLLNFDVIYNTGQGYPAVANTTARARLNAFFARGGGYLTLNNTNALTFLTASAPVLVPGTFTQTSTAAFGGTGIWSNVGGAASPLTGAFPATDFFYLPSNVTYFNAIPPTTVVDGRYLPDMVDADVNGPSAGWVAGLWRNRTSAASVATNNAPVIVHGDTTALNPANGNAPSRYFAIGTNPFSRSDFERIWGLIGQAVLWSDLTDEALLGQTITFDAIPTKTYTDSPDFVVSPTASSGLTVALAATGSCTLDSATSPATVHITAAGTCTITASQGGTANYSPAADVAQVVTILPEDAVATYTGDTIAFTAPGGNSKSVALAATIQDSSLIASFNDTTGGDVRLATVTFKEGSTTLCGPVAVTLTGAPLTTGSATCNATLNLGAHTITVVVGGSYTGTETAIVEVLQPDGSYVAGGGHISVGASAGTYAADPGSRLAFGFHVKYTRNLKNLIGHTKVVFERAGKVYEIRGTNPDSLGLVLRTPAGAACSGPPSATCWGIGDYRSKGNLVDITDPVNPVPVLSNLTIQISLIDKGTPGSNDLFGVTLTNGSTLVLSSDWNGAKTVPRPLTGGNLFAH